MWFLSPNRQQANKIQFDENILISPTVADGYNNRYIDDSIFTIKFMYHPTAATTIFKELHPCTVEDVGFNESLYHTLNLKGSFCLANKSFNLEGYWDEETIKYLVINIYQCDNETSAVKCKSLEEINDFFNDPLSRKYSVYFMMLKLIFMTTKIHLKILTNWITKQ